jgi:hypothetical protein
MDRQAFRKPHEPWVAAGGIDCQAADMVATISAEMPLGDVQKHLAEIGQWFPIDGALDRAIGDLVAENSTGPLRLGYGAWRDLLLGCQFRIAGEELITAGGRTMKNVAGYDLTKFMIGQRGVFGKIVTITVRTYRKPAGALAARFAASDRFIETIIDTPLRPRWAILKRREPDDVELWCGWLDETDALKFFEEQLPALSPIEILRQTVDEEQTLRGNLWDLAGDLGGDYFRASVPPIAILEFSGKSKLKNWAADAAFGIVRGNYSSEEIEPIELSANAVGGSVVFHSKDAEPRWKATAEELEILNRLREAFAAK